MTPARRTLFERFRWWLGGKPARTLVVGMAAGTVLLFAVLVVLALILPPGQYHGLAAGVGVVCGILGMFIVLEMEKP